MSKPWEEYQEQGQGPWSEFQGNEAGEQPPSAPANEGPISFKDALVQGAKNIPSNLVDTGMQMINPLLHPIDTAKGLYNVASGGVQKLIPGEQGDEQYADAVGQMFKDRYGSWDNFKKTLAKDPTGIMMDLSTVFGGSGAALKAVSLMGKLEKTAKVSSALLKASKYTDPVALAGKAGAPLERVIRNKTSQYAPTLYESALKIPPAIPNDIREQAVRTGIEGGYLPTEKGLAKLQRDIGGVNAEIARTIKDGANLGSVVDMNNVVTRIDQLKEFYKDYPRAKKYLEELDNIKNDVLGENPGTVSLDKAQRMKQRVYAINRKHYGEMKSVEVEADKALARGLKEEIVNQFPVLGKLNAKDSALINLEEVLERAVNRTRNYDILRMGDTIMSVAGATAGGPVGMGAAFIAKRIIESPTVKAKVAIALNKASKKATFAERSALKTPLHDIVFQLGRAKDYTGSYE